jgi:4-hydroxy-tetrahydrodipicolinate reductase
MSSKQPLRVVQWGTGNAGVHALRGIIEHPGLELAGVLAGVFVNNPKKVGVGAGELCQLPETGIRWSDDTDSVLGARPDGICYMATDYGRGRQVISDITGLLFTGINFIDTTLVQLTDPITMGSETVEALDAARRSGGPSFDRALGGSGNRSKISDP